jgi:hypothetical protein
MVSSILRLGSTTRNIHQPPSGIGIVSSALTAIAQIRMVTVERNVRLITGSKEFEQWKR